MTTNLVHLVRSLRRSPAGPLAAALTVALALGAGTSIFAVVDAVLLTPPPFSEPDSLVMVGETALDDSSGPLRAVGYDTLESWRDRARALAEIEAVDFTNLTLTGLGAAELTRAMNITPGLFALLRTSPARGRDFSPDDVGQPVAIVSHDFWRGKLGADPAVIGRELVLGGQTHTIVGVLPERFSFGFDRSDIWRPLPRPAAQAARARLRVRAIARLAPEVSPASLVAALDDVSRSAKPPARAAAVSMAAAFRGGSTQTLGLLAGAAALAMLIAFTNVAGLLIVRSMDRARELAVRTALGADGIEIARQLVLEAVAIVAAGTAAGVLIAFWATPDVGRLALQQFGGIGREVTASWRVIGAVSLIAAACACICGGLPALVASRRNVTDVLRRGATAAPRERWLRRGFVTAVVSVAFVLLVSVTLVGRSLMTVLAINPGLEATGVMTAAVALPAPRYPTDDRVVSFYSTLESDLTQRLGARSFGIIDELPLTHDRGRDLVSARLTDPAREAVIRSASPAYFDVMRIPIVAGRAFERRDDGSAPARVVISEALAARLFPGESPVGRQIVLAAQERPAEVIGVVRDVKLRSLDDPILPTVYLSMWQFPSRGTRLVVRSTRPDADATALIREHVGRLDGDLPVYGVASMANVIDQSPGVPVRRVLTAAFLGFALLAVVLGAIGLFGVVAHDVASRRAELALRIALGANPARILTSTLRQGVSMVGAALLIGGVLSFWASRVLAGVTNTSGHVDVVSAATASAVLLLAGVCAVLPAARRAAHTDPLTVLRN
jgi:putative ABC transport system permease protein